MNLNKQHRPLLLHSIQFPSHACEVNRNKTATPNVCKNTGLLQYLWLTCHCAAALKAQTALTVWQTPATCNEHTLACPSWNRVPALCNTPEPLAWGPQLPWGSGTAKARAQGSWLVGLCPLDFTTSALLPKRLRSREKAKEFREISSRLISEA